MNGGGRSCIRELVRSGGFLLHLESERKEKILMTPPVQ